MQEQNSASTNQRTEQAPSRTNDQTGSDLFPHGTCLLYDVGRQAYLETLDLQMALHRRCCNGVLAGAVIAVEHEPVITLGARTSSSNLLTSPEGFQRLGIQLVQTDRGGDVTYHGPGQLVVYPILDLRRLTRDVHTYLRLLEESVIRTLREFGISGRRNGPAGVWVGEKKICSIGVAIRRFVTYHGLALNISPDMNHFRLINPCGLSAGQMTSMAEMINPCPDLHQVKATLLDRFAEVFSIKLIPAPDASAVIHGSTSAKTE